MKEPAPQSGEPASSDFDLKIDEQVIKLLDLDHKLAFFIVTAAVATLAFTLNFSVSSKLLTELPHLKICWLIAAAVAALGSAGLVLFALHASIRSFRLHVQYRYERKSFDHLKDSQKTAWETLNKRANLARKWSLILLIATVSAQVSFLTYGFSKQGGQKMHHYGEDSTEVIPSESAFNIAFTNKETGQKITMHIPRVGVREQSKVDLTLDKVQQVADQVAHILREEL